MAKKLSIRGVMVPSDFDTTWALPYIERGLITPESTFRRELDAVTGDDVDIHINSPGGSVFAAWEMANAVAAWREATGKSATVTVGALAASAASAFAVMVAGRFRMHTNSKLMFHGATAGAWGGAQAMEDEADILGKINADIMTRLTTQYDLAPETVAEWFNEGRMGWLNADEAQAAGMVSELIDTLDPAIEFDSAAIDDMGGHGMQIAAVLDTSTPRDVTDADGIDPENANAEPPTLEDTTDGRDTADSDDAAEPPAAAGVLAEPADGAGDDVEPEAPAVDHDSDTPEDLAWQEGHDAGHAKGLIEARADFPAALEAAERKATEAFGFERDGLRAAVDAAEEQAETLGTELDEAAAALVRMTGERDETQVALEQARQGVSTLTAKLTKLLPGFAAPPLEDTAPESWEFAMAHAQTNGATYNDALAHCQAAYPALHAAYLKKHNPGAK